MLRSLIYRILFLLVLVMPTITVYSQIRFIDTVFDEFDSIPNVYYRTGIYQEDEDTLQLYFDLYEPVNDTMQKRPVIFWLHGGFAQGSRKEDKIIYFAERLAKRGYVNVSLDYRGHVFEESFSNPRFDAIYRGVQDTKAAISYFKEHAAEYRIDTSRMVVAGMSSGSYVSMHAAFMDQEEVPDTLIDTTYLGLLDPGYAFPTNFQVAVNCWGAILDTNWIQAGEIPVMSIVGMLDGAIPFESDSSSSGSFPICRTAARNGIRTELNAFPDAGHGLKIHSEEMSIKETNDRQHDYLDMACVNLAHFLSEVLYQTFDEYSDSSFKVFPNPTTSMVSLRIFDAMLHDITITVCDAQGNSVVAYQEGAVYDQTYKRSIDLSSFPAGVYYIRVDKISRWFKKKYLCKVIKL